MTTNKIHSTDDAPCWQCDSSGASRRTFLVSASGAVLAALVAAGARAEDLKFVRLTFVEAEGGQGTERSYPIPATDGASIDEQNDVIIVRHANSLYAFSLACPHQNTALRWYPQNQIFQCPRHHSRYQADGTFISGRATRNMDRFVIRREGNNLVVDLSRLYRSDTQRAEWDSAAIAL